MGWVRCLRLRTQKNIWVPLDDWKRCGLSQNPCLFHLIWLTLAQGLCHSTTAMSQKLGPWWVRAVMIGKNWNTSNLRKLVWRCLKMGFFYDLPNSSLFGDDLVACSVKKRIADVHGQIWGWVLLYQLRGLTLALQVIVLKERIGTLHGSKFFLRLEGRICKNPYLQGGFQRKSAIFSRNLWGIHRSTTVSLLADPEALHIFAEIAEVSTFCQVGSRGMWASASKNMKKKTCIFCDNYGLFFSLQNTSGWRFLDVFFLFWRGKISRVKIPLLVLKGDLSSPNYKMHPKNLHWNFKKASKPFLCSEFSHSMKLLFIGCISNNSWQRKFRVWLHLTAIPPRGQ